MTLARVDRLSEPDRAALLDFWIAGWSATLPHIDFAAQRGWLSDHLDALVAAGACLLLTRTADGAPVAFLTVHPGTGALDQLAVAPDHAGRGLARELIAEAKRLSPAGLRLRVNKANGRAYALYRHVGFVVTGEDVSARSGLPVWTMAWTPPNVTTGGATAIMPSSAKP